MSLRILIADDHEVTRRVLRALLETHAHWEICGEAADGEEAVAQAAELKPDVKHNHLPVADLVRGVVAALKEFGGRLRDDTAVVAARCVW